MTSAQESPKSMEWRQVAGRVAFFLFLVGLAAVLGFCKPVREFLDLHNIERLVLSLGAWGPLMIVLLGAVTPLLFIPRWPICFVCGLLYGVTRGTLLATFASLLGAWLQYVLARSLLANLTQKLVSHSRLARMAIPPDKAFLAIFLLRAFPLSNFVVTNLFAGALKLRSRPYLLATFLGMIPSSIMYAAWGKFARKPSPDFFLVAVAALLIIVLGYSLARKKAPAWLRPADEGIG